MKMQKHLGYLAVAIAATTLALPMSAFAAEDTTVQTTTTTTQDTMPKAKVHHHKKHCKHGCRKHCSKKYMKYTCYKRVGTSCHKVKACQYKPAHWWNTTWIPASKECWWVKR